ncbi:MAG: hypothetical protein ACO4CS_20655, partial [bacterium]
VVRSGLSKIKDVATKALPALKAGIPAGVKGALKGVAKTLIPGAAGFALGRMTAPKGEAPKPPKETKAPEVSTPAPSGPAAPSAPSKPFVKQTGDKKKDMETWAKANPRLAQVEKLRKQGASREEINKVMYDKGTLAATGTGKSAENKKPTEKSVEKDTKVKKEAYDIVLDYLISEGHAETVEEAHYIMLRLDAEHVQEIVSEGYQRNPEKGEMPDRSREAIPGQAPRGMPPRGNADREAFEKWYRLQQASKKKKSNVQVSHYEPEGGLIDEGGLYAMPGGSGTLADVMRQAGMHRAPVGQGRGYTPPATPAPVKGASLKKKPGSKNVA